jgi:hypothetical protein
LNDLLPRSRLAGSNVAELRALCAARLERAPPRVFERLTNDESNR